MIVKRLVIGFILCFLCVGCYDSVRTREDIAISGSTSVQVLAQELMDEYYKRNVVSKINVKGTDSTKGLIDVKNGVIDIGTSSRNLRTEEKSWNLTEQVIAYDGIVVVVNKNNKISDLLELDIRGIFSGEITNWNDLGGEDRKIKVVSREQGSGTRDSFEQSLKIQSLVDNAIVKNSNTDVKSIVQKDIDAIGYISLGTLNNNLKAVSINGIFADVDSINSKKYLLVRPFIFAWKEPLNSVSKNFITFVLGDDGQKIISKKYIPIRKVD